MSESSDGREPLPSLQFEIAEGMQAGGASCAGCQTRLATEYHELNGHVVCAVCRAKEEALHTSDQQWSRFITSAVYGFGAALAGALLYWSFVKLTGIEFGLMAIAVGWLVGKAVMKGSNIRGGRRYQYLAVALTYFSITLSYGGLIVEQMVKAPAADGDVKGKQPKGNAAPVAEPASPAEKDEEPAPGAAGLALGLGALILLMLASPFLGGFSNVIGWLIIAIGLFEAWKHTRLVPFSSGGPFPLGGGPVSPVAAPEAPPAES